MNSENNNSNVSNKNEENNNVNNNEEQSINHNNAVRQKERYTSRENDYNTPHKRDINRPSDDYNDLSKREENVKNLREQNLNKPNSGKSFAPSGATPKRTMPNSGPRKKTAPSYHNPYNKPQPDEEQTSGGTDSPKNNTTSPQENPNQPNSDKKPNSNVDKTNNSAGNTSDNSIEDGQEEQKETLPKNESVIKKAALNEAKNKAKKGTAQLVKKLMKSPYFWAVIGIIFVIIFLLILIVIIAGSSDTAYGDSIGLDNTGYWWPVGSAETVTENGRIYATGPPEVTYITSYFGYRDDVPEGASTDHGAIDIAQSPSNKYNIIASRSGTVITAVDGCPDGTLSFCKGTGYGNYIDIKHDDGNITRYGHLYAGSLLVKAGDQVDQGQVIAKMGSSGVSTGTHLHFEVRVNGAAVDPLDYVDPKNPRPTDYANTGYSTNGFNALKTSLSKTEFVSLMTKYGKKVGGDFQKNFASNASLIYDVSVKNNVNPELVVVTAGAEQGYRLCDGYYNFWGIGISNGKGCSSGPHYSNMTEGIKGYAKFLNEYAKKGSSYYSQIIKRYKQRKKASCAAGGYGTPDTFEGMQSIWSYIGSYWYNPGSSGLGGCYYLKAFIDEGFMPNKYNKSYYNKKCGSSTYGCEKSSCIKTNICEQSDYTKWQVEEKYKIRKNIFGI